MNWVGMVSSFELRASKAVPMFLGDRIARLHPDVLAEEGISEGDVLILRWDGKVTAVTVQESEPDKKKDVVLLDPYFFEATDFSPGTLLDLEPCPDEKLVSVTLHAERMVLGVDGNPFRLAHAVLDGKPVIQNEQVPALHLETGTGRTGFIPVKTRDAEVGVVDSKTELRIQLTEEEGPIAEPTHRRCL